ncbi:MAG: carbohydrate kinase, partial [Spirochaetales bacterium]|nr:carbohydrate kinase [Spirochaetales bacterium]
TAHAKVPVYHPLVDRSEQPMAAVRCATVDSIRDCIAAAHVTADRIAGVACTGQGDGVWALDGNGEAVEPAVLWNDNRAAGIVRKWQETGILSHHYEKGATVLWAGTSAAILQWMAVHDRRTFDRIHTVFNAKDWITYNLTGVIATDESDASIPFMDISRRVYDPGQAALLGLDDIVERLAPPGPSHEIIGRITADAAVETGLAEGTPVVRGLLDVVANAIGAGAADVGQSFAILGTTLINAVTLDAPDGAPDDIGATVCGARKDRWVRVLGSETGTPNLDWMVRLFDTSFDDEHDTSRVFQTIETLAKQSEAGARGIIYHPFINGERAPFLNADATSGFFGITEGSTRADLLRAVFEGTAMAARHNLTALGKDVRRIVVTGGGAANALWCQIMADVIGCTIAVPAGAEFGTRGAALVAAYGTGAISDLAWISDSAHESPHKEYIPNEGNGDMYDRIFAEYLGLIDMLTPFWERRGARLRSRR